MSEKPLYVPGMLGKSHMLLGAAGYLACAPTVLDHFHDQPSSSETLAGALVCAGAAMLPDLDHPQATVTRALGPITEIPSALLSKLAGGHRNGTHSFLFAALAGLAAWAALTAANGPWATLAMVFLLLSLVVRVLTDARGLVCACIAVLGATTIMMSHPRPAVITTAVVLGCLLHMLGDFITREGVPPFWPLLRRHYKVPLIGTTSSLTERLIACVCGLWSVWFYLTQVAAPTLVGHPVVVHASQIPAPPLPGGWLAVAVAVALFLMLFGRSASHSRA
jgi:membrane-bound metal-dependent hydrolase YbcI (DUF457 family)